MTLGIKRPLMTPAPPKLFQPIEEKDDERSLITRFASGTGATVFKLQEDKDNGEEDGIIVYSERKSKVEGRRKGYPNHRGRSCRFPNGWNTGFLRTGGIWLNESTIRNHKDGGEEFFIYVVEINGDGMRAAKLDQSRIDHLLSLPLRYERSTNSESLQSVKGVPVSLFVEISMDWFAANHIN
jgi:hypothetical protein